MTSGRDEMLDKRKPNYEELNAIFSAEFNKTGGAAHGGLTVRDYFAAKAMEIMANFYTDDYHVAIHAYKLADAMMKERNK